MKLLSLAAPCLFALVVLAGCASTTEIERQPYVGDKIPRPDRIIIYDFAATPGDVPTESAIATAQEIAKELRVKFEQGWI